MKLIRIIPLFAAVLLALHGTGIVRTLHKLSHHAQPSIAHSCIDAQSNTTPINQAPTEQPSEHPSDTDDEHDCDICLTLNSITPTQSAPHLDTLASAPKDNPFIITSQVLVYSAQQLGDRAARAPPIC